MGGDIRSMDEDSGGYGKYGLGKLPFGTSSKKYKCSRDCPYLTSKPSCKCPHWLLNRYFGWFGQFGIDKGKHGKGCPIYVCHVKGVNPDRYKARERMGNAKASSFANTTTRLKDKAVGFLRKPKFIKSPKATEGKADG